jgi:hypothetical protein
MKIVQCPNCGASATNLQNCEFCGSLFVRYDDNNLDSGQLFDNNSKFVGFMFPGLEHELCKNLSQQTDSTFIVTDVSYKGNIILQIVQTTGLDNLLGETPKSFPGIAVHVPFASDKEVEYERFIGIEESKLFISSYDSQLRCHDFAIDFGNDSVGATYLSTLYLMKQEGLNEFTMLEYSTSDYNFGAPEKTNKKSGCFIATAALGDYEHPIVVDLRLFRDNWLLKRKWGVSFTSWYYTHGPKAAYIIKNSKILRKATLVLIIKPLYFLVSPLINKSVNK